MAIPVLDRRARLLTAATAVFARDGLGAPVPAIAAAAGVGIGTFYREFPSKEALIAALALERVEWYALEARAALAEDDAGAALYALLERAAERQASDPLAGAALAATSDDEQVRAALRRAEHASARLLRAAQREGAVRADATHGDLKVVFAALRGTIAEGRDWRRALELLLAGLRS